MRAAGSEEEGYRLTRDFITAMMEHFRRQKTIHKRFAFQILLEVRFGFEQTQCGSVSYIKAAFPSIATVSIKKTLGYLLILGSVGFHLRYHHASPHVTDA